ncbi:hypothetical protein ACFX1Q_010489 [Malus domestica]
MDVHKLLIFLLFATASGWSQGGLQSLRQGSSLKVEEESHSLVSPNGAFSSGFYNVGKRAFCYAIWYTNSINKTVVWMANRDRPVNETRSRLTLRRNGNLVLTDGIGSTVWSTNTFSGVGMEVRLLETGNLVPISQANRVIWQSFDSPTTT